MFFSEELELGRMISIQDAANYPAKSTFKADKAVYADRQSVAREEFYKAQAIGLEPKATFVVWGDEYTGQPAVRHNGDVYKVIRSYSDGTFCYLTCVPL